MHEQKGGWRQLVDDGDFYEETDSSFTSPTHTPREALPATPEALLKRFLQSSLIDTNEPIELQQRNLNSPISSVKTFEELSIPKKLLRGVYDMGFIKPSKIQEQALPILMADPPQNMIAQSQSGTGKTAAFVLAMLSRVDPCKNYPQVLCLAPTYELAVQIGEVSAKMSKYCPEIEIKYAVRGEIMERGSKITEHILIGTPGKVLDWALKFRCFDLNEITVFILDEADIMIATQGHEDQCIRIHKHVPKTCQVMFFSATYDAQVMDFAEILVPQSTIIRLSKKDECLDSIKQFYVECNEEDAKYEAISTIYANLPGQAIVFCRTRKTADWLANKMIEEGFTVAVLSGEMTVENRIYVLDMFRKGCVTVLVTTNVLSRGIDVDQVSLVVNYDLPVDRMRSADYETYLHRIGRTGRFGKKGIAINLVDSTEAKSICDNISDHFSKRIELLDINCRDLKARIRS